MFPWVTFLTYAVLATATPGPNTIMSMSNGSQKGFVRGLPFNFGIWTGFTIVMLACTAFCSALSALIPRIKLPMLILGALYMLYLAYKTYRGPGEIREEEKDRGGYVSGLLLQFVNPKIYLYGIMSLEAYILPYYQGQWTILPAFAFVLSSIGFVFTLCWSAFGSLFKRLFSQKSRWLRTVMALLLVYCAVSLLLSY